VISGASAMFARKGGATHMRWGRIYLRAFAVVYLSGVALVVSRGPQLVHLLVPGSIAAVSAVAGFRARRRPRPTLHLLGMAGSYVGMLTAFYVDNGPKLPGWRLLPPVTFWFLPTLVALPFAVLALRRHSRDPAAIRLS
jgi:hypothetical protein